MTAASLKPADAFFFEDHTQIVVKCCDHGMVMYVSITSIKQQIAFTQPSICPIYAGEHSGAKRDSVIDYLPAIKGHDSLVLDYRPPMREPVSDEVLKRILTAIPTCPFVDGKYKQFMTDDCCPHLNRRR